MAKYYIDPAGSNGNNGSSGSPWLTLSYACSHTVSGDIIHVNAGTYTEVTQSVLPVGVSIEGAGATSIIHSHITANYTHTILLQSNSEGTDGNQSISNIKMTGGLTAYGAIRVEKRKNVTIHHCDFSEFFHDGVMFCGVTYGDDTEPSTYATGNVFRDNVVTDCATYSGSGPSGAGRGNLTIGGQQGMLIYNNIINQPDRGAGLTGFCIKYISGFFKGVKIYDNTLTRPPYDGETWDFAIELWNCRGGIEIYGNTIEGSVDISGNSSITNDAGGYGFAVKIHDNTIGFDTLQSGEQLGIDIERGQTGGFYVYNNLFKNLEVPFIFWQGNTDLVEDIYIYYNKCIGVGRAGANNGNGSYFGTIDGNDIDYENIHFLNNVIIAGNSGNPGTGIRAAFPGRATGINVKNNIIQGFNQPVYVASVGAYGTLNVENNIFNDNGSNNILYDTTPSTLVAQNNLVTAPPFVSSTDLHLTAERVGIDVGLTLDFEGSAVTAPPSIGVYEFGGLPPESIPVTTVTVTGMGGATTISVDNGTLQMSAHIDPHDATDKTVVWSVVNGTGSASIDQNGLLTAITDGTITVKATSNG
jgi:hypothetical protein